MVKEKFKKSIIHSIDVLETRVKGTTYMSDIVEMRKRYIYKDISKRDFIMDVQYLRSLKNIFNL